MLANARSLGYVFNPLSLFWCHDPSGALVCVIAEVRNTYGGRHCYLLRTDDAGRAETEKAFYVSPFYPVDGFYRMSVPEPGERLALSITLHRPGGCGVTARRRPCGGVGGEPANRLLAMRPALLRNETWLVRALITKHGIALWRKGLPVVPRPTTEEISCPASPASPTASLHSSGTRSELSCLCGCGRATRSGPSSTSSAASSGCSPACGCSTSAAAGAR